MFYLEWCILFECNDLETIIVYTMLLEGLELAKLLNCKRKRFLFLCWELGRKEVINWMQLGNYSDKERAGILKWWKTMRSAESYWLNYRIVGKESGRFGRFWLRISIYVGILSRHFMIVHKFDEENALFRMHSNSSCSESALFIK